MILVYLILSILSLFIIFSLIQYLFYNDDCDKIDIVISWVERDDKYIEDKNFWLEKEDNKINEKELERRSVDNQELKYLLRSIEKNFKNYNNIYLIVKDYQFPKYIKRDHPKIRIIKESEIVPNNYLPTFNSMTIELYLHHIPNLTTNYIYLNDDFIFLKPIDKNYFLDSNNKPTPLYTSDIKYKYINEYEIDLNSYNFKDGYAINNFILDSIAKEEKDGRYNVSHVPKIFNRNYDYKIEQKFRNYFIDDDDINIYDKTGMSKFRKNYNLYLVSILKEYLYKYWFGNKMKKTSCIFQTVFNLKDLEKMDIKEWQFMCINQINKPNIEEYHTFMGNIFPEKSSFEVI